MKLSSDRVVDEVHRAGGLAPLAAVERKVARSVGADRARVGVGLAVLAARLERVRLLDGSDGLRLISKDGT